MSGEVIVNAAAHPLRAQSVQAFAPAGLTIAEILGEAAPHAHVFVGGAPVPRERWAQVRPKAGAVVDVRVLPMGSGDNKNVWNIVAGIVITIVAVATYNYELIGYNTAFMLGSAGVSLALQGLVGLQTPEQTDTTSSFDRLNAITGSQNRANPYGVIPRIYGRYGYYPPYAARPYTEIGGSDQYLRMLLCLGYGPLEIGGKPCGPGYPKLTPNSGVDPDALKIGDTNLAHYDDVDWEIGTIDQMTLYTTDVDEVSVGAALDLQYTGDGEGWWYADNVSAVRTTAVDTDEISLDIVFPAGLFTVGSNGKMGDPTAVEFKIEYRPVGGGAWQPGPGDESQRLKNPKYRPGYWSHPNPGQGGSAPDPVWHPPQNPPEYYTPQGPGHFWAWGNYRETIRINKRWKVPQGQYDVRLTRVRSYIGNHEGKSMDAVWSVVRSIHYRWAWSWAQKDVVLMSVLIRATDQLDGVIDQLFVNATSMLPVWTGTQWQTQATRNPAWIFADILSGNANERAIDKTRLAVADLKEWGDDNDARGRYYDAVIDSPTTVFELARDVASVGRAAWSNQDGLYTIVRDVPTQVARQHFTPRNSWGFSGQINVMPPPHALRVQYISTVNWQQAERIVYDDGYSAANATRYVDLQLRGVTDPDQAWRLGRYHLAATRLRPAAYVLNADMEHIVCTRGDLVRVTHDVPLWGAGSGRITGVNASTLFLDESVVMEAGKRYCVRVRASDGSSHLSNVTTTPGRVTQLYPDALLPVEPGDLFMFGEQGQESVGLKVAKIEPGADLSAKLTLVDAAPEIEQADRGAIPPYDPHISGPVDITRLPPPRPTIETVRSDETVLLRAADGTLRPAIVVNFSFRSQPGPSSTRVEARIKRTGPAGAWRTIPDVRAEDGQVVFDAVEQGETYVIQLRGRSVYGPISPWTQSITTVIGMSTPPPDIGSLRIFGQTLSWQYPDPPRDFAGFRVRYHAGLNRQWSNAINATDALIAAPPFDTSVIPETAQTILVKAVDVAGNESRNVAVLVRGLGDPRVRNVIDSTPYGPEFPGTLTGGVRAQGQLQANDTSVFWGADDAPFWPHGGERFWDSQYEEMVYRADYLPDYDLIGDDSILILAPHVAAGSWRLEYLSDIDHLFWGGDDDLFWGGDDELFWPAGVWTSWPGRLEGVSRQLYQFRLITDAGAQQGIVREFTPIVDVPDIDEILQDVPIDAGGSQLPVKKRYRGIKTVSLTLQYDAGNNATTLRLRDRNPHGPLVEAESVSGASVPATVDAIIQGY